MRTWHHKWEPSENTFGNICGDTSKHSPSPLPKKKAFPPPPPPWANHLIGWVKFLFLKPFCHHVLPGLIPLPKEVGYLLSITDLSRGQFCHFFTKYFGSTLFSTISSFAAFINPSIWHMSYEIGHLAESTSQKLLKCWNGLPTCAYGREMNIRSPWLLATLEHTHTRVIVTQERFHRPLWSS